MPRAIFAALPSSNFRARGAWPSNGRARLGQIVRPLDSVAAYIPGGRYPLPSTVMMTVVPAQVAGVKRIVVVCPRPNAALLAAANLLGVREIGRIGGAQAIAAFAYGTRSVPRVDKIFGPGNRYVTAAKRLISPIALRRSLALRKCSLARAVTRYIASDGWPRLSTIPMRSRCSSPCASSPDVRDNAEQLSAPSNQLARRALAKWFSSRAQRRRRAAPIVSPNI